VDWLLANPKVEVNYVNRLGWTALLEAIVLSDGGPRHQQIVATLIRQGADVHNPDREGRSPLHHASALIRQDPGAARSRGGAVLALQLQ
jgi:ankyrin repeat protein